jgi:hypothetical protein
MKSKRGVVGMILNWIPATFIILLLMLVFLGIVGLMTVETKKDNLNTDFMIGNLDAHIELLAFLNLPLEGGIVLRNKLPDWARAVFSCGLPKKNCDNVLNLEKEIRDALENSLQESFFNTDLILETEGRKFVLGKGRGKKEGVAFIKFNVEEKEVFFGFSTGSLIRKKLKSSEVGDYLP